MHLGTKLNSTVRKSEVSRTQTCMLHRPALARKSMHENRRLALALARALLADGKALQAGNPSASGCILLASCWHLLASLQCFLPSAARRRFGCWTRPRNTWYRTYRPSQPRRPGVDQRVLVHGKIGAQAINSHQKGSTVCVKDFVVCSHL